MKEILKGLPLTTIIVIYLYVSGGLYLIGFWSTFDFDISNIVSLTDIPKSFIFPFIISNGVALIYFMIIAATKRDSKNPTTIPSAGKKEKIRAFFSFLFQIDTLLLYSMVAIFSFYNSDTYRIPVLLIISYVVSVLLGAKLTRTELAEKIIPDVVARSYLCAILIYTPIMSFALGKAKGTFIYTNKEVKYITATKSDSTITIQTRRDTSSLKLLGFLGEKIIISTLDNKKIFVLNQSAFNVVEIEDKSPNKWK
jgi:hypothetical protein